MCTRYYRRFDRQVVAAHFGLQNVVESASAFEPDYDIVPATNQPIVTHDKKTGERMLHFMRWGIVPKRATSIRRFKGFSTSTARAETITRRSTWRVPFRRQRCLVPASGFFERNQPGSEAKDYWAFRICDGDILAFAGLCDSWKQPDGTWLRSFAIVTTCANELIEPLHTRMPLILHPSDYDRWLAFEPSGSVAAARGKLPTDLLRPFPAGEMQALACHSKVPIRRSTWDSGSWLQSDLRYG